MILLDTATYAAAGTFTGTSVKIDQFTTDAVEFMLNVSAAATAAGDTLNVYIQASADNGTTWDDFVSFTQVLGNGGAKKFMARWSTMGGAPTVAMAAPAIATLAAGSVQQGPHGTLWRVQSVVVSATAASFTLKVMASGSIRKIK